MLGQYFSIKLRMEDIKYVLFDFDDTLCIHEKRTIDERKYHKDIQIDTIQYYGMISKAMKSFMVKCFDDGKELFLISSISFSETSKSKIEWVRQNYGVTLKNACVGSSDRKVTRLQAISDAYNIKPENILIVDDCFETLSQCESAGFTACSPMEIIVFMENISQSMTHD